MGGCWFCPFQLLINLLFVVLSAAGIFLWSLGTEKADGKRNAWGHRFFVWFFQKVSTSSKGAKSAIAVGLLEKAHGDVLEVGMGLGNTLGGYKWENIKRVVGIEPNLSMHPSLHKAMSRVKDDEAKKKVKLTNDPSLKIYNDGEFDCVVLMHVLCSIPDTERYMEELARVVKTGGTIIIFEHILDWNDDSSLHTFQHCAEPIWKRMCVNCRLTRRTDLVLKCSKNYDSSNLQLGYIKEVPVPWVTPHVYGTMTRL